MLESILIIVCSKLGIAFYAIITSLHRFVDDSTLPCHPVIEHRALASLLYLTTLHSVRPNSRPCSIGSTFFFPTISPMIGFRRRRRVTSLHETRQDGICMGIQVYVGA